MQGAEQFKMPWALYTGVEAARAIGVSPATVRRRLIARGLMSEGQSITHIYIDGAALDAIREHTPSPASLGDTAGHRDATLRETPAGVSPEAPAAFSELPNCNRQPGATASQKQENPELAARG